MRSFETGDLFEGARLVMKIGIREEIEEVAKRANESKDKKAKIDMGFDLFFGILGKAITENAEQEIYKFLSNIFECTPEEVKKMDPLVLFETMEKVASFEEWANFFKRVMKLIPKKH